MVKIAIIATTIALIIASIPGGIGLKMGEHVYRRMLKEKVDHLIDWILGTYKREDKSGPY